MTDVNYTTPKKLLVKTIKLGNPKVTKIKAKPVTNETAGEKLYTTTGIDYTALRKLLVNLIKLSNPKGTTVKTKLVTNKKTGEKEIKVWTRLPTVQYVEVNFEIQKEKT